VIAFDTEFIEYFNKKIHIFLEVDIFHEDSGFSLESTLSGLFPKHLIREQKEKCKSVMENLFDWTGDEYLHTMTAFHEVGLYHFLGYIRDLREDTPEFDSIYYDNEEDRKDLQDLCDKLNLNEMFEGSIKNAHELGEFLHDITTMQGLCFEDADFDMLPMLSNHRSIGDYSLEEALGVDFDYYREILPNDIRLRLEQKRGSSLLQNVILALEIIENLVAYRGSYKEFWAQGEPRSESEVQRLLDSYLSMHFKHDEYIDRSREVDTGNGKIDFKFYKAPTEKVLMEVKLASSSYLENGLTKQLASYMDSEGCNEAIYLIICYSEKELTKAKKLYEKIKDHNLGDNRIAIVYALDVSRRAVPSKMR